MHQFISTGQKANQILVAVLVFAALTFFPVATVFAEDTVNINTADIATLEMQLSGVGPQLAKRIVEFRERYGAFESIEALKDVRGIGDTLLQKNASKIVLE